MASILGVLGFVMGFGAIWFTSEALKRADQFGDALVRPHVRKLQNKIAQQDDARKELDDRIAQLERQVHILKLERVASKSDADAASAKNTEYDSTDQTDFTPSSIHAA